MMRRLIPVLLMLACDGPTPEPEPSVGADPAVRAQSGEARAGVVRDGVAAEAALFGGVNAEGQAGDIKIYNDRVQFIVQGAYPSHGLIHVGGGVIDADLVRPEGALGRDTIEDVFLAFGLSRLFEASVVEVVSDGSDGGDAVVVATGTDVPWDYFMGLLEHHEPVLDDMNLQITQTYRLAPDSYVLLITTKLVNEGGESVAFVLEDGMFMSGEDQRPWTAGAGFGELQAGRFESVTFAGRSAEATVSMWPAQDTYLVSGFSALAADLGIMLAEHAKTELHAGESVSLSRSLAIAPDPATSEAQRRSAQGVLLGQVDGTVTDVAGGVEGVRVHFVDDQGAVAGMALTDAQGNFAAQLSSGAWTAYAVAHGDIEHIDLPNPAGRYGPFTAESVNQAHLDALTGQTSPPPLAFASGRASPAGHSFQVHAANPVHIDLVVPQASVIRVRITDADGAPLPGVVDVQWSAGPAASEVPVELHKSLAISNGSRAAWAWTADGVVDVPAMAGTYNIEVGHSWRYSRASVEGVVLLAGQSQVVDVVLDEVVPRDNWLSLDPHLHGSPSFDGALPMEDRLITCAATGVDLPVSTDHDALGDYRPLASALGLDDRMKVIPGLEVTSLMRGHFNLYPVQPAPLDEVNGGAVPWWYPIDDTEDLVDRMREYGGPDALLQVNHPRSPGMFGLGRYKPEEGEPIDEDYFSWRFDTFELLNGGVDDVEAVRADWFSFLDKGVVRTPTGASDSHYRYIPCGMARTDVFLSVDDPSKVEPDDLRAALLSGHVVVASGTTLRAHLRAGDDKALPGDTLVADAATLTMSVRTPEWIEPGELRVYKDGVVIHTERIGGREPAPLNYEAEFAVSSSKDAWYVVEVQGDRAMGATWRGTTPYAVTNAFFLDVDGDGWTGPRER
ncbi:MAG: hypothetical protein ACI9MC_000255 [Kiritimatiellia bacterium]|jgi:hypothetical protein